MHFSYFVGNVPHNFPLARLVEKQMQDMGSVGGYEVTGGMREGSAASAYFPASLGKGRSRTECERAVGVKYWGGWEWMGHDGLIQGTAVEKWHCLA